MEQQRPGLLRRFFRRCWNLLNGLRRVVLNLLFLLILIVVVAGLFSEQLPEVPDGAALVINPAGTLVDQASYIDPVAGLMGGVDVGAEVLVSDLVKAIDTAAQDARIKLIVLQLDGMEYGGLSKQQELAAALARFRGQGKTVVAVGDSYSQDQYWLAAQADQVLMNPQGAVLLQGYGMYTNYFREALDKLQVKFHVFRVGTYKSAVEPLLRNDMSDEVKRDNLGWLNALWQQYKEGVATRRHITPAQLDEYITTIDQVFAAQDGDAARAALQWKLVDALKTREEINDWLVEQVGADADGLFRAVEFSDYLVASRHLSVPQVGGDKVGVIVASGMILDGEQRAGLVGGDTLAGLIRQARQDDAVKAVVLRVDSEGGSAFAAEIIRQELLQLKAAGKPLVVSMGSIAASGGYWIAADADQVWATPATLTGSIGIFGAFPTVESTLDRVGIHTDGVGTTPLAGALRIDRPLDPVVGRAIQSNIENGYRRFLDVVAGGRDMAVAQVDEVAQGRVWAGSDAQRIGLVDQLGGLSDAIAAAAKLAGSERYQPQWIEPALTPQELLLRKLTGTTETHAPVARGLFSGASAFAPLAPLLKQLQQLTRWNDPHAAYLYCGGCARL